MSINCLDINFNIAFQALNRAKEFRFEAHFSEMPQRAVQHTTVEPQSLAFGNILFPFMCRLQTNIYCPEHPLILI